MTRARDLADFNLDGKAVTINESSADLDFRVESDGNTHGLFLEASSGEIGIGEDNPATTVHITASAPALSLNTAASMTSGNRADINVYNSDRSGVGLIRFGAVTDNVGTNMQFYTRPASGSLSEGMRLDSSGNLLVGGTEINPQNQSSGAGSALRADGRGLFRCADTNALAANRTGSDGEIIRIGRDGSTIAQINSISGPQIALVQGSTGLAFYNGGNQIYPTDGSGNRDATIDLGYSSSKFKDGYFSGTLFAEAFTGRADTDTAIQMTGSNIIKFFTNSSEKMRLDQDGKLLLGATSTIAGAHISHLYDSVNGSGITLKSTDSSGNTHNQVIFDRNGSTVGTISTTASNTAYGTTSDRRLKSNIQDAESASDKIDALRVRQFDWNVDGSHQDYGLIAQELEPIEPLAVTGDADSDEMMGVDYSKLVPMLLKEIQELRSRVAALEAN